MNGFECRLHALRHTSATYMIASGADVRTVSDYLGHASPPMTLDIYADVDPEAKRQAVKYIGGAFDDTMSVFQREAEKRRAEMKSAEAESKSDKVAGMSPESIPFTADELRAMLAVIEQMD